ncbi:MAG: DUF2071 domain-containing protein [Deltaproteobacteria bacterium]|nr:MAG: DUF2071 domain-containing protein [Deltaproteobacteria bacterium]
MNLADHVDHRPFPLPEAPWVMHQAWCDFLFLHWPVSVDEIRARVPEPLELDLRGGQAWLGIIPFHMTDVRPRGTVNLPGLSAFPELNVRTYVRYQGRSGVFFLGLEASHRVAVETARLTYGLPYFKADMHWEREDGVIRYRSARTDRRGPPAVFRSVHKPVGPFRYAEPGSLEHWLSERYCLFTCADGVVHTTDVHHLPWPLRDAEVHIEENSMALAHDIHLPAAAPHAMYSPGVDVLVWGPRKVEG